MRPSTLQVSLALMWLALAAPPHGVDGGSVLVWLPFISKSIKITVMPVAEAMADRGHEVVVVLPHPTPENKKHPKVKEIAIDGRYFNQMTEKFSKKALQTGGNVQPPIQEFLENAVITTENALQHEEIQGYLKNGKKFDVVLCMAAMMGETGYFLARKFDAALGLYFTGMVSFVTVDNAMGQPHNTAYLPMPMLEFGTDMTFWQRTVNFLATGVMWGARDFYVLSRAEQTLDKLFPGEQRPSLLELERNASVAFTFGHPLLLDGWRPTSYNFVHLGMANCRKPNPKFEDKRLQEFLDGANEGVVYVSFGSVLKASEMSPEKLKDLLKVFGSLKQKILWKWETDVMEGKPENVMLHKWLPQQDVLGHPNVKVFVSHGGQSSFQETLCHQKPAVFISVMGDQHANARESERIGFGIHLSFQSMTPEQISSALNKVLNDPKYLRRAQEHGSALMDQKEHPLERAVWWLEHTMRHPNVYRGINPVHKLNTIQYFQLDVIVFLTMVISTIIFLIAKLVICCCRCCKQPNKAKTE